MQKRSWKLVVGGRLNSGMGGQKGRVGHQGPRMDGRPKSSGRPGGSGSLHKNWRPGGVGVPRRVNGRPKSKGGWEE